MTMNVIPAAPGTYLLAADTTVSPARLSAKIPVVGWTHVQGSAAYPICAKPYEGYPKVRAILLPDGSVSSPEEPIPFESEAEWLEGLEYAEPDVAWTEHPADAEPDTPGQSGSEVYVSPPVTFGSKTYKTNSFWSIPSENMIFPVEANAPYPKDGRCEKVTRAEYFGLKKQGAIVIDPHLTGPTEVEDAVEDSVEDDAMDLI